MLLPLYSSHVNKQLSEAFTPRTCLSSRLFFPKLFKQVYRLNSVQTLKKKTAYRKLHDIDAGLAASSIIWVSPTPALCDTSAHVGTSAQRFHTFQTSSLAFSLPAPQTSFWHFSQAVPHRRHTHTTFLEMVWHLRGFRTHEEIQTIIPVLIHWFFSARFHMGIISERTHNHRNRLALAPLQYALAPGVCNKSCFANGNQ